MANKDDTLGKDFSAQPADNSAPSLPHYELFHVTANKEASKRIANMLRNAGARINETVWYEIGQPEYVIEVHRDDLLIAEDAFARDFGPGKTTTSNGRNTKDAP